MNATQSAGEAMHVTTSPGGTAAGPGPDAHPANTRRPVGWVRRWLGGRDVFISYARDDGATYATALAKALAQRALTCWFDQWGTTPGTSLPRKLVRALRRSAVLVLVGTPRAARSSHVREEVNIFLETGKFIVPISIHGTVFDNLNGLPFAEEHGEPRESTVDRVVNTVGYWRQSRRIAAERHDRGVATQQAVAPGGQFVARVTTSGTAVVTGTRGGSELWRLAQPIGGVNGIAVSADGERLAITSPQHGLLAAARGDQEAQVLTTTGPRVFVLSADGSAIAAHVGLELMTWRLHGARYELASRQALARGGPSALSISPGGDFVVSVTAAAASTGNCRAYEARMWKANRIRETSPGPMREVAEAGHCSGITMPAVSDDGRMIVTGDTSRLGIWQVGSERRALGIADREDAVLALTDDSRVVVLPLSPSALVAELCRRGAEPPASEDWEKYFGPEPFKPACADVSLSGPGR